jgi:F-type H+-transporting ATPase subunit epsilon
MHLEIITPDKKVFEGEIISVRVPGTSGSFEVLDNHTPIISSLSDGEVRVKAKGSKDLNFKTTSGVIEVINNQIIILTEAAAE